MRSFIALSGTILLILASVPFAHAAATVAAPTPSPTPIAAPTPDATPSVSPAVPATSSSASGPYTISFKYLPGQDLNYSTNLSASASASFQSKSQSGTFAAKFTTVTDQITKKVDSAGNGTLAFKVDSLKIAVSVNGKSIPIPIKQSDITSATSTGTITMSPRGTFVDVDPGRAVKGTDAQQMKLGETMIAAMISDLAFLPDHPVNVLDTWRGGLNMAQAGFVISMKMTLEGVKVVDSHNVAQIGIKIFITAAPKQDPTKTHAKTPSGSVQISGQGELDFDLDNGYAQSFIVDLTALMKSTPGIHGHVNSSQFGQNFSIPQTASFACHYDSTLLGVSTVSAPAPNPTPAATPAQAVQ
jgi:hypothetical protein